MTVHNTQKKREIAKVSKKAQILAENCPNVAQGGRSPNVSIPSLKAYILSYNILKFEGNRSRGSAWSRHGPFWHAVLAAKISSYRSLPLSFLT